MIGALAFPAICVIDDEEEDYRPILRALNDQQLSCVHLRGDTDSSLPADPLTTLRLVFLDLHLSGTVGKNAASHTAAVFAKVVSPRSPPVVVIIWSKYAGDSTSVDDSPPEDQETEAELFRRTLLEAEPTYKGRLIWVEMAKPKLMERPSEEEWVAQIKLQIDATLVDYHAVSALWSWESLVRNAASRVAEEITVLSLLTASSSEAGLRTAMQLLASAQAGGTMSPESAPRHLVAVLASLLADCLEEPRGLEKLAHHGAWLSAPTPGGTTAGTVRGLNTLLLTAAAPSGPPFVPGTVYRASSVEQFTDALGEQSGLFDACCQDKPSSASAAEWRKAAQAVFVELSPPCDIAQGYRRSALLVGGLIVPATMRKRANRGDSLFALPILSSRWPSHGSGAQDVLLMFCSRYKLTLPAVAVPDWLHPLFRLRELPTAAIRNWHSSQAARIGYVSLAETP